MKEYGGYIQLDTYYGQEYYPDLLPLSSGRAALRLLIRTNGIKKLFLPDLCCSSVWEACEEEGISWEFYPVNHQFHPNFHQTLEEDEWLLLVNLYGLLSDETIRRITRQFPRVIADYTHAFFQRPLKDVPTLYSCRKFFGVPDGSYLSPGSLSLSLAKACQTLPVDHSYERMHFLLGRFEAPASLFYPEYASNNERFTQDPPRQMSKLTHNLLRAIDYEEAGRRRNQNFSYLHEKLGHINRLPLPIIPNPYTYPFWYREDSPSGSWLREQLIQQKIYIPVLWPEILKLCPTDSFAHQAALNILPLPVDQRYTPEDMKEIVKILFAFVNIPW